MSPGQVRGFMIIGLVAAAVLHAAAHAQPAQAPPAQAPAPEAAAARQPRVLALRSELPERDPEQSPMNPAGLLMRELVRQAVLLAAREELGAATRDQTLREDVSAAEGQPAPLGVTMIAVPMQSLTFRLWQEQGEGRRPLFERKIGMPPSATMVTLNYVALAEAMESLSRRELVETLRGAGFDGTANPRDAAAEPDERTQELLADMTVVAQFEAVRRLHAALREGESPALLGALARGYANLGRLTHRDWSSAHEAFKARGILYAQRCAGVHGSATPASLWHRAYALALAGLHGDALEDLAAAERLRKQRPDEAAEPPEWVALIDAYCRYDTPALREAAQQDESFAPLASWLALLTTEGSGSQGWVLETGKEALDATPDNFYAIEAMADVAGVNYNHALTQIGPAMIVLATPERLRQIEGLPQDVREALPPARPGDAAPQDRRRAIAEALLRARDDTGEPSWAVLGRMLQEIDFTHARRRAVFMGWQWGVGGEATAEFLDEVQPLIHDHPYAPFLRHYAMPTAVWRREAPTIMRGVEVVDPQHQYATMFGATTGVEAPGRLQGRQATTLSYYHMDLTADDFWGQIARYRDEEQRPSKVRFAQFLQKVSPHSPLAVMALLEADPLNLTLGRHWEKQFAHHPGVLRVLAEGYEQSGRDDDAVRVLERYLEVGRDHYGVRRLSRLYLRRGDEERWLATLLSGLELEDYGLHHANINHDIARHYLETGRPREALPYAQAAATSGASWAMQGLAWCYEALGQREQALRWHQRVAERYENKPSWMLLFHHRSGLGEQRLLAELRPTLETAAENGDHTARFERGMLMVLDGDAAGGLDQVLQAMGLAEASYYAVHAALLAQELGDAAQRDAALAAAAAMPAGARHAGQEAFIELAKLLRQALDGQLDLSAAETLAEREDPAVGTKVLYLVGRFLELQGEPEKARSYYERCVRRTDNDKLPVTLAWKRLEALGERPAEILQTPPEEVKRSTDRPPG